MTLETQSSKAVAQGNGATVNWPYTFPIPSESELVVTVINMDTGLTSVLSPAVFTVTGIGGPSGGNVTYPLSGSPLSVSYKITVQRVVPLTQETDLINQGGAYPADIEDALDYLTMITQQLEEVLDRTVQFPVSDSAIGVLPPVDVRANKFFSFDNDGQPTASGAIDSSVAVSAAMIPVVGASTVAAALVLLGIPGATFETFALAQVALIQPTVNFIATAGYTSAGDLGGALYHRVTSGTFQLTTGDGANWRLAETRITPQMFGVKADDATDDTTAFQNALNMTATAGIPLYIPPGIIRLTAKVTWPNGSQIIGAGQAGANYTSNYSWLHFDHTGIGLEAKGITGARSIRGLNFYRTQPVPGGGWVPSASDFDISIQGANDIAINDCMFLNPTRLMQIVGDAATGYGCGRVNLNNIKGQPLFLGIDMTQVYDSCYFDEIHFWPFWTLGVEPNVAAYTLANAYAFIFRRVDNPKIGRMFAYGYFRGFAVFNQPVVGPLPGGTVNLMHADVLGMDNCTVAFLVNIDVVGATVNVNDFYGGAAAPSLEQAIVVLGTTNIITMSRTYCYAATSAVALAGVGNLMTIDYARSAIISGTEFDIAATNTLRLQLIPATSAPTKYTTTGITEVPEWRNYTPVITANAGAFTLVSATGRFRRIGNTIDVEMIITITTNGAAAGWVNATIPALAAGVGQWSLSGRENAVTGKMVNGEIGASAVFASLRFYDNTYPGANGAQITVSGSYECA